MVAALGRLSGEVKSRSPSPQRERQAWRQPRKHVYRMGPASENRLQRLAACVVRR
jgi:hypothetical protein